MSFKRGDVIQIVDSKHPWFPCLLIVDEIKRWGVQAYVLVPTSNTGSQFPNMAYNRLDWGSFKLVGPALFAEAEGVKT